MRLSEFFARKKKMIGKIEREKFFDKDIEEEILINKNRQNLDFAKFQTLAENNFGWTGPYLNKKEQVQFAAFEALLRSKFADYPENWVLIRKREILSQSGANGLILKVGPLNADVFVVKSPVGDQQPNELISEYAFGSLVGNTIRKSYLPNFLYTFGTLACSSPETEEINDDKKLASWCENENPEIQIVMEYAKESFNFENSVLSHHKIVVEFMGQVFNAISFAWINFRFSHNDLHAANVIIRPVPNNESWSIPLEFSLGRVNVKNVAVIIDFGNAIFEFDGVMMPSDFMVSQPINDLFTFLKSIKTATSNMRSNLLPEKDSYEESFEEMDKLDEIVDEVYEKLKTIADSENWMTTNVLKKFMTFYFEKIVPLHSFENYFESSRYSLDTVELEKSLNSFFVVNQNNKRKQTDDDIDIANKKPKF